MAKNLVIVESPAKAKTINKILGPDFVVTSSVGHVRDLPEKKLGVDLEHGFKPQYVLMKRKKAVVDQIKRQARECQAVYLAPDPDREGEAIAWHIEEILKPANPDKPFFRVQYNEITPQAVRKAFEHPGSLNLKRVDAQQARRILDRIVGYLVSPMLWRRIQRGLSAGRVQSVALRLVCEREDQITNFVPLAYWVMGAKVRKRVDPRDPFRVRLARVDDQKVDVRSAEDAERIRADLEGRALRVAEITRREISKRPFPPFITSSLQQAASGALGFSPKRTMSIAQHLYEGVDLGDGPAGLITYMRTDSFSVAQEAVQACRRMIVETFGEEYCPEQPNIYRSRGGAQEAHEAIRPTEVRRTPESLGGRLDAAELKLYRLIWQRFVASQMAPARIEQRSVKVAALPPEGRTTAYLFQANASDVKFPGYMRVSGVEAAKKKEGSGQEEDLERIPEVSEGEDLECLEWLSERKETQPPPRYSEATLVRALEANGIGRPSTYAQILSTLQDRQYVVTEKRSLVPTDLGLQVCRLLVATLEQLFNVKFTAGMESALDEVENGNVEWTKMLAEFYGQFAGWMEQTREPPADSGQARKLLTALEDVKEWAPPVKRGKRTLSDERFVTSIRKQLQDGKKPLSRRQLEALARVGSRYRRQAPGVAAAVEEAGYGDFMRQPESSPPDAATLKKLDLVKDLGLDDFARKFVDSLLERVRGGRGLTPAQARVLGRVVLQHAAQIPDFESVKADLNIEPAEPAGEDHESDELLRSLSTLAQWKAPVKRGKFVFDDQAFYRSLSEQFARKRFLSERQRAALKKMIGRYREQVPDFETLAQKCGIVAKAGRERKSRDGAAE